METVPIKHSAVRHDYYRVETRGGERRWLAVPLGTPARIVSTRLPRVTTA